MELVYLWVDNYKNIRNQGFNFSPRFECDYDEKKEKLIIKENKYYVSIFPKNFNVTAIVGENGSGKSNLISKLQKQNILIYKNGKLYSNYFYNKKCNLTINKYEETTNHIYIDNDFIKMNIEASYNNYFFDYTKSNLYKLIEAETINLGFDIPKFLENFYTLILDHNDEFQLKEIFKFNPTTIELHEQIYSLYNEKKFEYLDKLNDKYKFEQLTKEKLLVFLYSNLCMQPHLNMTKIENNILSIENEILEKNNLFKFNNITKTYQLLKKLKDTFSLSDFKEIYGDYKKEIAELRNYRYLNIDLVDDKNRKYSNLSQGERKFFTESLMIYDSIKKNQYKNILIILDEPDLSLHPQWQKKYLKELVNLFSKFTNKNFHLILTSHSPYILSDLPKENVIFLEKYKKDEDKDQKEGNCKNVSKDIDIKPFGANIHTLLSHGFFMKDGLMGEFAKSKIEEIKKFYEIVKFLEPKNKKNKRILKILYLFKIKKFNHIQSIIGEPFLQTIIKNYLDELEQIFDNDIYKNKKRNNLLKQFSSKELEEYLESLKNAKN